MKKFRVSLFALAIAFATFSAFSTNQPLFTGYLADIDNNASTDHASPFVDEAESDVTSIVNSIGWTQFKSQRCPGSSTTCAVRVVNDVVQETETGTYTEP